MLTIPPSKPQHYFIRNRTLLLDILVVLVIAGRRQMRPKAKHDVLGLTYICLGAVMMSPMDPIVNLLHFCLGSHEKLDPKRVFWGYYTGSHYMVIVEHLHNLTSLLTSVYKADCVSSLCFRDGVKLFQW